MFKKNSKQQLWSSAVRVELIMENITILFCFLRAVMWIPFALTQLFFSRWQCTHARHTCVCTKNGDTRACNKFTYVCVWAAIAVFIQAAVYSIAVMLCRQIVVMILLLIRRKLVCVRPTNSSLAMFSRSSLCALVHLSLFVWVEFRILVLVHRRRQWFFLFLNMTYCILLS